MPGILTHMPCRVIAAMLIDLGLGQAPNVSSPSSAVWPVYYDNEPDGPGVPDSVITVFGTAGVSRGRDMHGELATHDGFQVRVRANDKDAGHAKANAILVALCGVRLKDVNVGSDSYTVWTVVPTSPVVPLGKEAGQTKRSVFVLNALASMRMN